MHGRRDIDQVSAYFDAAADTLTFGDGLDISGAIGCNTPASWSGVYTVAATDLEIR